MKIAQVWPVMCAASTVSARRVAQREFASAAMQRCSDRAGRREPPAVLRATAARAAARPPHPGHAHPPRTACTTQRLHHHRTTRRCPWAAPSHAPREIDVFCEKASSGDGGGVSRTARGGAGPARCVTHLSGRFLAACSAARHLQSRSRSPPRVTLRRCECPTQLHVFSSRQLIDGVCQDMLISLYP